MRRLVLVASALLLASCGDSTQSQPLEPRLDASSGDSAFDASPTDSSQADTSVEAASDSGLDALHQNPIPDAAGDSAADADAQTVADAAPDSLDAAEEGSTVPDAAPDVIHDATSELPTGPVEPGFYTYTVVPTYSLINPPAVAWHPSGDYALVLDATNTVYRYDRLANTLTSAAAAGASVSWRTVEFAPDGAKAVLLGNDTSAKEGRIYVWDHAASQLTEMATDRLAGGSYESVAWSPDGSSCRLLGRNSSTSNIIAYLWKLDLAAGRSDVKATNTSAGCQDIAWATDQFDAQAVAIVCGINGAQLLHLNGGGQFVTHTGNVGNTSRIAGRPQGDYALAVCSSCSGKLYRFAKGTWEADYYSPQALGGYQIGFSTDGRRALVLGGYSDVTHSGQAYEYRHDLYSQNALMDVSIPNFDQAPWNADTYVELNDVAWRPGCDAGLIVGGSNTYGSKKGYLIKFQVDNGTKCP